MPRATRHADVTPAPPDLGAVAAEAQEAVSRAVMVVARLERIADAGEAGAPFPPGTDAHSIALLINVGRQAGAGLDATAGQMARLSLEERLAGACLAAERAEGDAATARGRHRARPARKPRRGQLELIPGGKATVPALSGAAFLAAFRHIAAAKTLTIGTGAAAAAAMVTVSASGLAVLPDYSPAPAAHHRAVVLAGVDPASAVPVPSRRAPYAPRHAKPVTFAASASPVPSSVPSPAAPLPVPPVLSPQPSATPAGVLDVATEQAVIGPLGRAQVVFAAVGGTVSWSASAPPGVTLDESGGILKAGESEVVTVTVQPGTAAGSGMVTITGGHGNATQVAVTWVALPVI